MSGHDNPKGRQDLFRVPDQQENTPEVRPMSLATAVAVLREALDSETIRGFLNIEGLQASLGTAVEMTEPTFDDPDEAQREEKKRSFAADIAAKQKVLEALAAIPQELIDKMPERSRTIGTIVSALEKHLQSESGLTIVEKPEES